MKAIHSARFRKQAWTKAELQLLARMYPDTRTQDLVRVFRRPAGKIYQTAGRLGLVKSAAFHADAKRSGRFTKLYLSGAEYRFPKGHVPANKGLRRPGYAPGRMAQTQFKKGRPAHDASNYVPIGTEKIDKKRNVLMRKLTDDPSIFPVKRWRPVHVMAWEAVNGPVPAGHICVFRRGMKTFVAAEITADKCEVITFAENMRRNSFHNNYPKELGLLIHARAVLSRTINSRKKKLEEQNHRPA